MAFNDMLLKVRNLKKHYPISSSFLSGPSVYARAVDGINFEVERGEIFGIVGESGCGKSTAAKSLIRLEEPTDGEIIFNGEDITEYDESRLREFRREVQMIFQDPDSSFDPRMNIGDAIAEPLIVQGMQNSEKRNAIVADLLERVNLSTEDMKRYPHEFSGGQKQRIALARALAVNPQLLVADEPVSALDVSIQSEILGLIKQFQEEFGLSVIVISHNLGVIQEICDRVAVMYLGGFVEVGKTEELFNDPQHPYTKSLLSAIPTPDPTDRGLGKGLVGDVPDPTNPPSGCRFHTRCPAVIQPSEYSLEQTEWQHVLHLRKQLNAGKVDLETIAKVYAAEGEQGQGSDQSVEDVPTDEMTSLIRKEYEIPQTLSDQDAENTFSHALETLAAGNTEDAQSLLNEYFTTICEQKEVDLKEHEGREVACHLHSEEAGDSEDKEAPISGND
jgi:peptide/nickel transport system ATP-binding protein